MTWRVAIAALKQETATFNPVPTRYDDFHVTRGDELLACYHGTQTELAGAIDLFTEDGRFDLVPLLAADAVSGGPIAAADLDRLLGELLSLVEQQRGVDAACIVCHGAMAGQDEPDVEGRLLAAIRAILGPVPLVASLDLHAVLTERMLAAADLLVPFHTYPHVDQYTTGRRAARHVVRRLEGAARPATVRVRLPMLVRGDELITATGRFGQAIDMCRDIEDAPGGLAAGVLIGNAFTDVPDLATNVLVATDDAARSQHEAERIARFMWEHRALFQAELTPLDEAIRQAAAADGLVVVSDAADATSSGASGDSNAILSGLLAARFARRALLAIVDAPAVAAAWEAGVGGQRTFSLGGTRDTVRFRPVEVHARVCSLHDEPFTYENGTTGSPGRVAVLDCGTISILVTERPVYVVGQRVFMAHGLEPAEFDLVVVKSPNGFRTFYESIARHIIPVDAPGSTSANLHSLPYQHCARPMFPLDEDAVAPWEG